MIIAKKLSDLQNIISDIRTRKLSIGFVPTMGALHNGHISLVENVLKTHEVCVCSIFVNPTQFNNPEDFAKYPITIEDDINILEKNGCHILFLPSEEEMYSPNENLINYDLGFLETILEGKYRPGHFQGVCQIVDKLLIAVKPDSLILGQKDFQQCMVVKTMMEQKKYKVKLIISETVRENSGLAMSSRNRRLTQNEIIAASTIYNSLSFLRENIKNGVDIDLIINDARKMLEDVGFIIDYVSIADAETLLPIHEYGSNTKLVALAAAYLNNVRLIDNLLLN